MPAPSDPAALVARANRLLLCLQTQRKPILAFDELRTSASSLTVFLYEKTFAQNDIFDRVVRAPQYEDDFLHNADLVVEALRARFGSRLDGVTGDGIYVGDAHQLDRFLGIFEQLLETGSDFIEDDLEPVELAGEAFDLGGSLLDLESDAAWWQQQQRLAAQGDFSNINDDEFAALEELGMRFPEHLATTRRRLQSLRALALHRSGPTLRTQPGKDLTTLRERDKARFRNAYERLLDEERREARLAAQRQALQSKLAREHDRHTRKVEQVRLQRLAEDLAREAKARQTQREAREEALIRTMFETAFDAEREQLLARRAQEAQEQAKRDREALRKYEAAKAYAQDKLDMIQEELRREEAQRKAERRHQKEAMNRLAKEMKDELARRLNQMRVALDAREEDRLLVNTTAIERAFALLHENAQALVKLGA